MGEVPGHDPRLDGLRAVAAISVVGFHCGLRAATGGCFGVDVFFVLSGWLITGLLAREIERTGAIDIRAFMRRRIRRLMPALAVVVAASAALIPGAWPYGLAAATYTLNVVVGFWPQANVFTHTWSLATEFQFYLVWPCVMLMLAKLGRRRASMALVVAWLAMTLAREGARFGGMPWPMAYYLPVFHATGLLLGGAAALSPWKPRLGLLGMSLVFAMLVAAQTLFVGPPPDLRLTVITWPVMFAEVAAALVVLDPPRFLAWKPLPQIGVISYSLYLWHLPVEWFVRDWQPGPRFVFVLAVSLVLATTSWLIIEQPFMRRLRGDASRGSTSLPAGQPGR